MANTAEPTQSIRIRVEVVYELKGDLTILNAMEAAKELVEKAREYGAVDGQVVFGRQKFGLK